jgi:hypothetical protein
LSAGESAPGTHWIGGWVEHKAGLDDMERRKMLPPPRLELRTLGHPAHNQSLYRLSYPGPSIFEIYNSNLGQESYYPDRSCSGFSSVSDDNVATVLIATLLFTSF